MLLGSQAIRLTFAELGPAMTTSTRKLRPVEIVECLIDMYVAGGVDLRTVSLAEFKMRFREVACSLYR